MSLETLIIELKKIYDVHPNAEAIIVLESPESGSQTFDVLDVNYDHLTKSAVIDI
jgi:hypothetical protein